MLFYKLYSHKQVNVNIQDYIIDWNDAPSKSQQILQDFLYSYWKNKVILSEFRIPGSLLRADIMNITDKIYLEYSPECTHDYSPHFHGNRLNFIKRIKNDMNKMQWAERNGFKTVEIIEKDLDYLSRKYFLEKFDILL